MMASALRTAICMALQRTCPLPCWYGFDRIDQLEEMRRKGRPYVWADHAYFERGYNKGNFRILPKVGHQTDILNVPGDRLGRYCPFPRDWRQGDKIIVIPVPPMHVRWYGAGDWVRDTVEALRHHTDRKIVVKEKNGPPLSQFLPEAWAVVSHSSVASVEAAYHGVPVFGPETSPAFHVGLDDLSRIETPIRPDREPWLKTLSYSQFSLQEIVSGEAWSILKELYTWPGVNDVCPNAERPQAVCH